MEIIDIMKAHFPYQIKILTKQQIPYNVLGYTGKGTSRLLTTTCFRRFDVDDLKADSSVRRGRHILHCIIITLFPFLCLKANSESRCGHGFVFAPGELVSSSWISVSGSESAEAIIQTIHRACLLLCLTVKMTRELRASPRIPFQFR